MRHVVNLAVPRTGSVYVQHTLSNIRGPHRHMHLLPGIDWTHAGMTPVPDEWRPDFFLGVVRNPFDLLVSVWCNLRRMDVQMHALDRAYAGLPFRDWVTLVAHRRHHWPQAYPLHFQLFRPDWSLGVDYLARFETLDEDLSVVAGLTGGKFTPRAAMNSSLRGRDWRRYYDEDLFCVVEDAWFADLSYFGYGRDGVESARALTSFGQDPHPLHTVVPRDTRPFDVEE